ncbi:hypothetical protein SPFM1_00264 [Salmonella phage SPFM1]|nr:hypothetical protein SPFM1_00264 [Salmonella phage SPFM1]
MSFRIATSPYVVRKSHAHSYNVPKHCNYLNARQKSLKDVRKILHNEWGEIDPTVWLFHAMYISTPVEDQQLNEQMAGRPFSISTPGKAGTAVDKPGLVHALMVSKYNAGDSYDDFIQADMCEFFTEYVKDKLSRDPVFHSFLKRYQPGQKCLILFATVALIKENLHLEYANMIWDVVEKKFAWWASKMTPYNHKLFEGKSIPIVPVVDVKALYYRLDDKSSKAFIAERYMERFPIECRIAGVMLNPPPSIEMSATLTPGLGIGLLGMDEVHEHFHLVYMKEYINTAATNPVDLDTFYDVLDRRGIKLIILPTVTLQRFLLVCTGVQAIYDALEMGKSGEKWIFDTTEDPTGLRESRDGVKVVVKKGVRTGLIIRPTYVPGRQQTIFAIQTGAGKSKSFMTDPNSRFYYQNEVSEAAMTPPERAEPYKCTFDNYGFDLEVHILQRAAIEYAFQYKLTEHHAHIPSLRTFIFHKVFAEKIKAPKMGKQHGRITTERGDAYYEVPIRQAERAILAWAEENMHAKRGSMVEIQMTYTSMGVRV